MKIAMIGGAGFIGSHIAKAYLDAGHDVFVVDSLINGSRETIDRRARFYQLDIRDTKLPTMLQRERPDIVSYHAVQRERRPLPMEELSLTDADVHIRGLINVLDSCVGAAVHTIIFASGGNSLFGRLPPQVAGKPIVDEQTPLCPQRPSDISKAAGEWYVRYYSHQFGLKHIILRYADVYGERDISLAQHPLSYFVYALLVERSPTIRGAADAVHDHIFIDDVVAANVNALGYTGNATMHISSGCGYTLNQLYQAVACHFQTATEPVYISNSLVEASSCILDNRLAGRLLKWQPTIDLSLGVRRAVERMRERLGNKANVGAAREVDEYGPSLICVL
jgi:UDP-glucose 4-epimerase